MSVRAGVGKERGFLCHGGLVPLLSLSLRRVPATDQPRACHCFLLIIAQLIEK